MKIFKKLTLGIAGIVFAAGTAWADGHIEGAVKARQALMKLYSHNLGQLGAMAKTTIPYDADAASKAAANLAALASLDQSTLWPQGSDNGSIKDTRALPAMWTKYPEVLTKATAFKEAVAAMNDAAGTDLASLQAAMGAVGKAYGACHKAYRQPKD